ncbi:hypothetical protein [Streptomyces sp. NPDC001759]
MKVIAGSLITYIELRYQQGEAASATGHVHVIKTLHRLKAEARPLSTAEADTRFTAGLADPDNKVPVHELTGRTTVHWQLLTFLIGSSPARWPSSPSRTAPAAPAGPPPNGSLPRAASAPA